ncbi:MAG: type II toxin-antitoxin system PemK/MazF family toxin [Gemmatimonadales bacterium]
MAGVTLSRGEIYLVSPPPGNDPKRARPLVVEPPDAVRIQSGHGDLCPGQFQRRRAIDRSTRRSREWVKHRSVVNCDQLVLVPKSRLRRYLGQLSEEQLAALHDALRVALAIE